MKIDMLMLFNDRVDSILDNIINGNRQEVLQQIREIDNPLSAAYVGMYLYENIPNSLVESKIWLMNALYDGE